MYEYTLFIGMNDKDTHKQELSTEKFKERIANTLGDCTIREGATGYYTHDNGIRVIEKSLEVTKFGGTKKSIVNMVKQLKQILNQECIILKTQVSKSDFI